MNPDEIVTLKFFSRDGFALKINAPRKQFEGLKEAFRYRLYWLSPDGYIGLATAPLVEIKGPGFSWDRHLSWEHCLDDWEQNDE